MENQQQGSVPVNLILDAQALDRAIVQAVLDSRLGEMIREEIQQKVTPDSYALRAAVQKAVDQSIAQAVRRELEHPAREQVIKKAVSDLATEEVLQTLAKKAWDALLAKGNY